MARLRALWPRARAQNADSALTKAG